MQVAKNKRKNSPHLGSHGGEGGGGLIGLESYGFRVLGFCKSSSLLQLQSDGFPGSSVYWFPIQSFPSY